jgi:hypothetical protein
VIIPDLRNKFKESVLIEAVKTIKSYLKSARISSGNVKSRDQFAKSIIPSGKAN